MTFSLKYHGFYYYKINNIITELNTILGDIINNSYKSSGYNLLLSKSIATPIISFVV